MFWFHTYPYYSIPNQVHICTLLYRMLHSFISIEINWTCPHLTRRICAQLAGSQTNLVSFFVGPPQEPLHGVEDPWKGRSKKGCKKSKMKQDKSLFKGAYHGPTFLFHIFILAFNQLTSSRLLSHLFLTLLIAKSHLLLADMFDTQRLQPHNRVALRVESHH